MNNIEDILDEFYNIWMDDVINTPLVYARRISSPSITINDLTINNFQTRTSTQPLHQQLINNMYNVRRSMELYSQSRHDTVNRFGHVGDQRGRRRVEQNQQTSNRLQSVTNNELTLSDLFSEDFLQSFVDLVNDYPDGDAEYEDVKVTLTTDEFDKLERICVDGDQYTDKDCNICIEPFAKLNVLRKLPCGHIFHEDCVKDWLCKENVNCPVCRHDTRVTIDE